MAHLSLRLLGGFAVTLGGEPVTDFGTKKARALLAYLAVEVTRPHRRESLSTLLWPDYSDRSARRNLRGALANLRTAIGDHEAACPFLLTTRDTLQFNPESDYRLDVALLADAASASKQLPTDRLAEAAESVTGDFLAGFTLEDAVGFDDWSAVMQQRTRRQALSLMGDAIDRLTTEGDLDRALVFAWRRVELAPWHEAAQRQLIGLLATTGQRSAALRQYLECVSLLKAELGVAPSAATTALYEQIRSAGPIPSVAVSARTSGSRFPPFPDAAVPQDGPEPVFVAREAELARLTASLRAAIAGHGHVVFVTGEAGQGKTALMQAFAAQAQEQIPDLVVADGHCNAYTGVGDPYLPFRDILVLLTGDVDARYAAGALTQVQVRRLWHALPSVATAMLMDGRDLIGTFVPAVPLAQRAAAYVSSGDNWVHELLAHVEAGQARSEGPHQDDLFEQATAVLKSVARDTPLLLIVDDLQWADPGSIALLFHLGRRLEGSCILLVGAYRSEEIAAGRLGERHPLETVIHEFRRDWGEIEIDLAQADGERFVQALVDSEPHALSRDFCKTLYHRTAGHPLYVVELLRGMQERGDLVRDAAGRWKEGRELDWDQLPARVEAVIAERIARLDRLSRQTLRIAGVEGEVFTAEVAAEVLAGIEPHVAIGDLISRLSGPLCRRHRLVRAEGVRQFGNRRLSLYRFRHILFQTYLYRDLDPVERARLHEQVGTAMERLYGERSADLSLELARHFEEAKLLHKAVAYLHQAGERALHLSANRQAVEHLTRSLSLLERLPPLPDHSQRELAIQLALGAGLLASRGYGSPDVGAAYGRARVLCERADETAGTMQALWGLGIYYVMRSEIAVALGVASQMLSVAAGLDDPVQDALAHFVMGWAQLQSGSCTDAYDHLQHVVDFYDTEQHRSLAFTYGADLGVSSLTWTAWALWAMGYPDQALARSSQALSLAHSADYLFGLNFAESAAGYMVSAFYGDLEGAAYHNEIESRLAHEGKFPFYQAMGVAHRGRLLAERRQLDQGIGLLREGLALQEAIGVEAYRPLYLTWLAEALAQTGQVDQGLAASQQALDLVDKTGEGFVAAEAHRIRGELLLCRDAGAAESCFRQALDVARRQRARMWELRSMVSLARLWREQGKVKQARRQLAEIYGWFTEGFAARDLQAARQLLDQLSGQSHDLDSLVS